MERETLAAPPESLVIRCDPRDAMPRRTLIEVHEAQQDAPVRRWIHSRIDAERGDIRQPLPSSDGGIATYWEITILPERSSNT